MRFYFLERRPSETQKTSVKYNDSSPRWREVFDFVMVSAGSTLSINVNNKVGIMDVVTSLKLSKVGRGRGRASLGLGSGCRVSEEFVCSPVSAHVCTHEAMVMLPCWQTARNMFSPRMELAATCPILRQLLATVLRAQLNKPCCKLDALAPGSHAACLPCHCCIARHCVVLQSRFQDSMLGRVQIPVADVARNGCLKDTWALLVSVCCSHSMYTDLDSSSF